MAYDVFISYSSPDKAIADAICEALEGQGINCWIAPRNILPGTKYSKAIVDAITTSSLLVLVFSASSNKSRDVTSELDLAFQDEKDIPILAFRIENLKPAEDKAFYLAASHWLDAFSPPLETHLERLARDVKSLLEGKPPLKRLPPLKPLPPPLPPSRNWKPILIAAGAVLALIIFVAWLFKPQPGTGGGKGNGVATNASNNATGAVNTTINNTQTTNPGTDNTNIGNTASNPPPTGGPGYQQEFDKAIKLLYDTNPANAREGIRLLGKVCESGNEDLYWTAMKQLTDYVQDKAHWNGEATQLSTEMRTNVFRALEVIAARRPPYPANADDKYMRNKRRDLKYTDLRGLELRGGVHLEYVDFLGAHLDGAVLTEARLEGVVLRYASLTGVNLSGSDMKGVDFSHADINKADLRRVTGLNWYDVRDTQNWQCANLEDALVKDITAQSNGKLPPKNCQ